MSDFVDFPKIPRWNRSVVITEKLDGTNAQVSVEMAPDSENLLTPGERSVEGALIVLGQNGVKYWFQTGSRNRWITPEADNFGFARWAYAHAQELVDGLGEGTHYGEWWGSGIQRGYGWAPREEIQPVQCREMEEGSSDACCTG